MWALAEPSGGHGGQQAADVHWLRPAAQPDPGDWWGCDAAKAFCCNALTRHGPLVRHVSSCWAPGTSLDHSRNPGSNAATAPAGSNGARFSASKRLQRKSPHGLAGESRWKLAECGCERQPATWRLVGWQAARDVGFKVTYGDGSRPSVVKAFAHDVDPRAFVVVYTARRRAVAAVENLRAAFPDTPIYARALDLRCPTARPKRCSSHRLSPAKGRARPLIVTSFGTAVLASAPVPGAAAADMRSVRTEKSHPRALPAGQIRCSSCGPSGWAGGRRGRPPVVQARGGAFGRGRHAHNHCQHGGGNSAGQCAAEGPGRRPGGAATAAGEGAAAADGRAVRLTPPAAAVRQGSALACRPPAAAAQWGPAPACRLRADMQSCPHPRRSFVSTAACLSVRQKRMQATLDKVLHP